MRLRASGGRWTARTLHLYVILAAGCIAPASRTGEPVRTLEDVPIKRLESAASEPGALTVEDRHLSEFDSARVETIDLPTALKLAGGQTISVALLRERIEVAKAGLDEASSLFLPALRVGGGYSRHDGRIQETEGNVFDTSKSSLGGGPTVELSVDPGDAYFKRLTSLQRVDAAEHGEDRTRAESMIRAAMLYYDMLAAHAQVGVVHESMEHTRAQVELSERLVKAEAELRVNLARARAEEARDQGEYLARIQEHHQVSIELATWLRLPHRTLLEPADTQVNPVTLVDMTQTVDALVQSALSRRPDIQEMEALRSASEKELEGARWTPWLPEINAFAGYGGFGGGSNGFMGEFGDRFDGGAGLSWTFDGFGFGDMARVRRARAQLKQARLRIESLKDQIVAEVITTWERIRSLDGRMTAARAQIVAAQEALELVRARFRADAALQIEVLEAIRELAAARAHLVEATTAYNQAQYLLFYLVEGNAWSTEP